MMLSIDGYQEFCLRDESYSCDSLKPCGLVARVVVFFFFYYYFSLPSSVTNAVEYELEEVFPIVF